ncbi:oligopeptidase A [Thiorhodovibrio frisius]|uniref:oligopeptidase A n=1 Tax=Thiorhodovibrio frisius TaxID=631362 RepID=H8Z1F3_9GAMM|nr:oligopeptidase A [Thiorhodovibrio frisius]EIC22502.1 Zn-dependent oligopeptidase [Thiorhodovibrio frisius]WPL24802.1 Oligopeptidase A [Thiorhodovibrio frisius]
MTNPLLTDQSLPEFSAIRPEHIEPALDARLSECRALIEALTSNPDSATWETFIEPIETADDRLNRTWSPVSHLNAVMNSEALREAYNAGLPKLSDYGTEVGQNPALLQGYQAVARQPGLDAAQRKMLEHSIRDFHLSGVDLPPAQKARFREINQRLTRLTSQYEENLLDATNAWFKHIEQQDLLAGLPESALALAHQQARERDLDGWVLTLDIPSYLPVIMYAKDDTLRRELYEAYCTRASDQGPHAGRWDNGPLMEEILALRHERAQLLSFANYAELSLAPKMARSTDEVMAFLNDLAAHSLNHARTELDEVRTFAATEFGHQSLEPWDVAYFSEQLRQHKYAISQEELRPYFPISRVLPGLFEIARRLFDIRISEAEAPGLWHPDVHFYQLHDSTGELRAQFYLDPYARQKKRGGAWMDVYANRYFSAGQQQIPVAYLVCNFSPPVEGKPALLTHQEVLTLFHEFGHGLHHMLTRIDHPAIAGINNVPWDAVELPSQFMENWCWERESLDLISGHVETGEPLPDALFERMRAARNFQSAMLMVRQLEFALFDFRLHSEFDPDAGARIYEILDQVRDQVAVIKPPSFNRFAHGFSHIFAGGYAAGYYSYKWAEVLSADAFSLFEERGIFDTATGQAFRERILEQGGAAEAMELFIAFRGREPTTEALLRHSGISSAQAQSAT